jgi:diadenosine tetraphosphate (Ap4A) HIT family hydrolase
LTTGAAPAVYEGLLARRRVQVIKNDDFERNFLLREYQETHSYFINVEQSMADLLKFYNSVLAMLIPVGAVLFQFLKGSLSFVFMAILTFVFFLLGLYVLAMYIELRIRKIKTLEQIAVFREKMIEVNPGLKDILKMITSIRLCPPYLRRPSSEWYTVIYISFVNGLAAACCTGFGINIVLGTNPGCTWQIFPTVVLPVSVFACVWISLLLWATRYSYIYDLKREKEYGVTNEYSFLDPSPYFPVLFRPFKWIAEKYEKRVRKKYAPQDGRAAINDEELDCEFCSCLRQGCEIIAENNHWFSKWDKFPVSRGHALIIPRVHDRSFFDLSSEELVSLSEIIGRVRATIDRQYSPDGFNVGVNIGKYAGQTVKHLHIHLIPRYRGDVPTPEGGVRNVIPGKGKPRP